MPGPMKVKRYPLSNVARALVVVALILQLLAWAFVVYYYPTYAKPSLLIVPAIFSAVYVLFLLLLRYRYALLENYPYLVNLPAFAYRLGIEKNPELKGKIINKVFTVHAFATVYISVLDVALTSTVLPFTGQGTYTAFILPAILVIVAVFVITIFAVYRNIYRSFAGSKKR